MMETLGIIEVMFVGNHIIYQYLTENMVQTLAKWYDQKLEKILGHLSGHILCVEENIM